jgi:hypothetical protein
MKMRSPKNIKLEAPVVCEPIPEPEDRAPGDLCSSDSNCYGSGNCKSGVCESPLKVGDSCDENKDCNVGQFAWPTGEKYEGEVCKGQMHGRGKKTWEDGKKYEGQFKENKITG